MSMPDGLGFEPSSGEFAVPCSRQLFPLGFPGWKEPSSSTHSPYCPRV